MSEALLNARKRKTDELAGALLGLDDADLDKTAEEIYGAVKPVARVVICGGAGSGKTKLGQLLAKRLEVPAIDLDELIPGGWTEDKKEYQRRFLVGREALWNKLPPKGWVVEHVEACHPHMLEIFRPDYAVLMNPGVPHLKAMAEAREAVAGESEGKRKVRAYHSALMAKKQFEKADGALILRTTGWALKRLR